jgi:NADP-dependent 3-hydroxy acid dehydrogenase YdfG
VGQTLNDTVAIATGASSGIGDATARRLAEPGASVADIVNISSQAGRTAPKNYGVYNMTHFGVNGFTEALRQEITQQHVRVGVLEPGGVTTELSSHNTGASRTDLDAFCASTETLLPQDIADGVAYMVTWPHRASVAELWIMHTDQA